MPAAIDPSDVWVVVPMYNEAQVITETLTELRAYFPCVVCVDDASRDASARLAADAGARVVRHPINLGQGAALQTGVEYALSDPGCRAVVTFDADGQHRPADAVAMVAQLGSTGPQGQIIDVVLGSRFLDGRTVLSGPKKVVLKLAVAYTRASVHMKLTDTHNGLRAFTRHGASVLNITQNGMAHATEILEQVAQNSLGYIEYPVEIRYTDYSRAKGQSLLNSVNILVDLLLR